MTDQHKAAPPPVILFADDEEVNRTLIKRRLTRAGYEVITAKNGAEAVEQARTLSPDLVVLDLMMPVMDGQQACRTLKADAATRNVPVIILSARDETEVKVSCLSNGANDYISKPFRVEELIARVEVAIRLKRERDNLRASAEQAQARADAAYEKTLLDALTSLLNRYGLQRALARELSRARRYKRALSCLMLDIDHFKTINDTMGHPVGDLAIMQFASSLHDAMRGSDIICRYGGEEFLVLLPETNLAGAATFAEKVRSTIAARAFGEGEHSFTLTMSAGAAELQNQESGNDMIARADAALYRAKQLGRNRVEIAEKE